MRGGKGDTSYVKLINFFEISPYISKGDLSVLRFVCLLLVMLSAWILKTPFLHFYKGVCPYVCQCVGPSVGSSHFLKIAFQVHCRASIRRLIWEGPTSTSLNDRQSSHQFILMSYVHASVMCFFSEFSKTMFEILRQRHAHMCTRLQEHTLRETYMFVFFHYNTHTRAH